jgi:cytochrome c oxidase subunit II
VDSSLTSPSAEIDGSPAPNSPPRSRRRPLVLVGLVGVALLFGGCKVPSFGFYPGATKQGQTTFHLWQQFFIAGLIVGGFVLILILWAIFRYRRKSDAIPKQTQYHTVLEISYTVVPILIVIGLFIITVFAENEVTAVTPNPSATITVKAFQWGWEFDYPGGVKVIGQTTQAPTMVMPAGQSVRINLKSLDVLHGFYVPQFNFSRYASPGYNTQFDFNVLHTGIYRGQCTQLCGLYHSLMFFNVRAVTPNQYAVWLRAQQALVRAHPSSVPQLPSGVKAGSSNSNITTSGSDAFSD